VRRVSAWLLAAALAAPAILSVAVPGVDVDALRCAIKCGHAVKAGAVCCPAESGASWKTCPSDDSALLGFSPAALGVLTPAFRVAPPSGSFALARPGSPAPRFLLDAPPDPVPLSLS
jgi:hypothetical protein